MTAVSKPGQPVLFIHGLWHASWTWRRWLPLFAERGFEPRALTLRGHGTGERGYRGIGLKNHLADLAQEASIVDRPPVLIGHSFGGLLIQHLMAEQTFPAVVLIASIPGRYPARVLMRNGARHPLLFAKSTIQNDLRAMVSTPRVVRELLFSESTPEEIVSSCQAQLTGAWPGLFRQMVASKPPPPLPGTPTLVLAPSADPSFTVAMQRRLAATHDAELKVIDGSGHDLPLDLGWRQAAQATLRWLEPKLSPAVPRGPQTSGLRQ